MDPNAMKKLAILVALVALLLAVYPALAIMAEPAYLPHENPLTARSTPDISMLMLTYGRAFDLTRMRQYDDATALLNELKQSNVPAEMQFIIDRFNALSQQLLNALSQTEALLDEAQNALSLNLLEEAKQKLDEAGAAIKNTETALADIERGAIAVRSATGAFPSLSAQSLEELENSVARLHELIDEYNRLLLSRTERYAFQSAKLAPTELSLNVEPGVVFVGDRFIASGQLLGGNAPLSGRRLSLSLGNSQVAVVTTDAHGSYEASLAVPYEYVYTMTLRAIYLPAGSDLDTYLAGESPAATIKTAFYPTSLNVSLPPTAYPGLPTAVGGNITSTGAASERTVRITMDGLPPQEVKTTAGFSFSLTPPAQAQSGQKELIIEALPQGRYAGATQKLSLDISRMVLASSLETPRMALAPGTLRVKGTVRHDQSPVPNAKVSLSFKGHSATAVTSASGSFAVTLDLPMDLSLVGPNSLDIRVEPAEPWYATLQTRTWVFTLNPVNLGLMAVAISTLGVVLYRARRRPEPRAELRLNPARPRMSPVTPSAVAKYAFSGNKGRVLRAYATCQETVSKVTGTNIAPSQTLSEYLGMVIPRIRGEAKTFRGLTALAEVALYSGRPIDEDMAASAESLAKTTKEGLHETA